MSKQCPICGAVNAQEDVFCNNCGNPLSQQPFQPQQQPYQPRPRTAPANSFDVKSIAKTIMRYISFILIGLTIFTLVLSILHFTGAYEVNAKASGSGYGETMNETGSGMMSDLFELDETDAFKPLVFCVRAYGVFNLVLTVLSGLIVVKIFQGNRKIRRSVNTYSLTGLIGSVAFLVFFLLTGTYKMSMLGASIKIVIQPHFTVWLSVVAFALLYALNYLTKKKPRRRY